MVRENVEKKWNFCIKLQRNLLENLHHNNNQKMDGFGKERALSFKAIEMVDDQRWNLKRGVMHVDTQVNQ